MAENQSSLEEVAHKASDDLFDILALLDSAKSALNVGGMEARLIGLAQQIAQGIIKSFDSHI